MADNLIIRRRMRRTAMISFAPIHRIAWLCSCALLAVACSSLHAQTQTQTAIPAPGVDPSAPPPLFGNTPPTDPNQVHMLHAMAKERSVLRQKEIVDDTNQLLDLAKQLKAAVDKSSKDQLSLNVVATATQIEKLAKSVKEKMRDGQ
jgi:hypothetical protein